MKIAIASVCAALIPVGASASNAQSSDTSSLVGDWSGTSICQVRPSGCHDENVVLRFSHPHENKIDVEADKIVNGKAEFMGSGEWTYNSEDRSLTWQMPRGAWRLVVSGTEMKGTLVVPENVVFRKIDLHKSK
jgi:hypothetical protein